MTSQRELKILGTAQGVSLFLFVPSGVWRLRETDGG
jgi:hypothetical protein